MYINQVSVFLENSAGRLESALKVLKDADVDIKSLSLADTNDYGMLRMIVSAPETAVEALKRAGYSAHLTKVLAVKLDNIVGALADLLKTMTDCGINIEYMYDLSSADNACMIIKVSDREKSMEALKDKGITFLGDSEI